MIKIENYEVMGFEHAIRGMRNPMNSWAKSDSQYCYEQPSCHVCPVHEVIEETGIEKCNEPRCGIDKNGNNVYSHLIVGPNDHELMMKLANGGAVHAKYRRMITVYVDITAPLYWWKEFDTYKVGTVANSCSTMHKIHANEFTLEDFSTDTIADMDSQYYLNVLRAVIDGLNCARERYLEYKEGQTQIDAVEAKDQWRAMIELLPTSYNQKRTVMLNYEVLTNIYESRKNHKLDEWHIFCDMIRSLPYADELICCHDAESHA